MENETNESGLCKYRHVFGTEGQGFHSVRFMNIAILDLLMTIVVVGLMAYFAKLSLFYTLVLLVIILAIGECMHLLFCVETNTTRFIKKYVLV